MKAVRYRSYGDSGVLVYEDAGRPVAGADQIIDYTATTLLSAVAGQRFDVVLNLVRTDAEETAALADLPAVHDLAAAGRLAGKTVLIP